MQTPEQRSAYNNAGADDTSACMDLKDKWEIKPVCFPYQTHYNLIQKLKSGKNRMDFSPITFFIHVIILPVGTTCNKSIYSELS